MSSEKRPNYEDHSELTAEAAGFAPELAALAKQLSDEADSLACCFPPRIADPFPARAEMAATTTRPNRRGARQLALVAGMCAATIVVAFLSWQAALQFGRGDAVVERARITVEQSHQMAQRNDAVDNARQPADPPGGEENLLQGLSGAEQEAVLDLIDAPLAQPTSLSI